MSSSHSHWLRPLRDFEDVGELKRLIQKGRVYILPPREIATVFIRTKDSVIQIQYDYNRTISAVFENLNRSFIYIELGNMQNE